MELKFNDLTALLDVDDKTLLRWIREKTIPAYHINHQYLFNKTEIKEWILKNNHPVSPKMLDMMDLNTPSNLTQLLRKGGIFMNIGGKNPIDAIKNAVLAMTLPPEIDYDTLTYSLIEREEMMPTAVGKGIAIPHPRNPIIADIENESVTFCLLKETIDYDAPDNLPVFALFIILSANSRRHLQILARISFLCQGGEFSKFVHDQRSSDAILDWIEKKEALRNHNHS